MKRVWHVVLLTSAVWFLLDACLLLYFMSTPPVQIATNDVPQNLVKLSPPDGSGGANVGPPGFVNPKFPVKEGEVQPEAEPPAPVDQSLLGRLMSGLRSSPGGPGENGRPVKIDKSKEEEMKTKFKINQFNLMASDMISLNRSLPDVRNSRCRSKRFETEGLPSTSVIMVFHNEAWSTLLRSIHSVINRSPRRLLHEIILIDDASEREHLKEPLHAYIKTLPVKTTLRHMPNRSGLVKARLFGAKLASARTMTYLDAHIEVTKGWLEPLMERIAGDRKRVVCPVIDVISDDTFEYVTASDSTWGGFNWKLQFRWFTGPHGDREDKSIPIKSPAMAGGLFSIERDYFYEIGAYDDGMLIWGGENLEMSFRIWQCGGSVEIVPCSHVGHVFRKQTPYTFPGGTSHVIHHNSLRTTDVWMEDYKLFFYKVMPGVENVDKGDISGRLKFKKDAKCKSFRWYLEHIYPESHIPAQYWSLGEIRNPATKVCVDTMSEKAGSPGKGSACHGLGGNQAWTLGVHGLLRADDMCLEAVRSAVKMVQCDYGKESHKWQYVENNQQLRNRDSGTCLTLNKESGSLLLAACSPVTDFQMWKLEGYTGTLRGGPPE